MISEFRLHVIKQIAGIEAKETYNAHDVSISKTYKGEGVFYFSERGREESVVYTFQLDSAKNKSEWMLRPLEKEESLVGLIARKVLAPGYKGYFEVSEPGTQIFPVAQLINMGSINNYPPGYQSMLDDALDGEQKYINSYISQHGGFIGRNAIEKKIALVVDSILQVVSALHGKPHEENEVFLYGCFLDNAFGYLRPRVEKANATLSWSVKYGISVPASDLASSSNEAREAQKALAYYEKSMDAKYKEIVVSSLKAMIPNANGKDFEVQEPFVRPVESIQLVGLLHSSKFNPVELNPTPQLETDWEILVKIFERVNSIWIERCLGSKLMK